MLSTILKWFGYRNDGSIVITSPSSSATVSGVVTFHGTSIQTVNGQALPAQSFSISADLSAVSGAFTFHAENSAGHAADRTVIVVNDPIKNLPFWGINIHWGWGAPYTNGSAIAAKCVALGARVLRSNVSSGGVTSLKNFISAYAAPAGLTVYPVLLPNVSADEASSYTKGFSFGVEMAGMKGYVPFYELCNEMASYAIVGNVDGDSPNHYDNTKFLQIRGMCRGIVAGIKSVDPNAKFAMGDTWLHYGLTDMLWNGTSPASSGSADASKVVRWDLTSWHWYDNMGNIEAAGGGAKNCLSHLHSAYPGIPIRITEYGCYASSFSDETAITNYLTGANLMGKWDSKRATYNINGADSYELFDDGRAGDEGKFGVVLNDGTTNKSIRWSAVAAFIAAHP